MTSLAAADRPTPTNWLYRLTWLGLLLLPFLISLPHLDDYAWNYDEGPLLQTAALANDGHPLYEEIVFNKPPLLIWWLQAVFKVGGPTVAPARFSILLVNLLGLGALGWLATRWWRQRWAGPLAAGLWLLAPDTLVRLSVVMNDLPAMTLLLLTLVAATRARQTGSRWWTAVSGILFGLTLGLHLLLLFAGPVILFLLFWGKTFGKNQLMEAGLFGLVTVMATAVWLLPSAGDGFWRWVITYNLAELGPDLQAWSANNASRLANFLLHDHWLLLLLGLLALPRLLGTGHKRMGQTAVLWFVLTIFTFIQLSPLWPHYLIFSLYPLAILAAGGLVEGFSEIRQDLNQRIQRPYGRAFRLGATLGLAALLIWQYAGQSPEWSVWKAESAAARHFLEKRPESEAMAISDDQFLLFAAGRLTPPALAESSTKRISTGFLTVPEIINGYFTYGVSEMVFTNGRFNQLPDLEQWAVTQAVAQTRFDDITVYELAAFPELGTAVQSLLGSGIRLNGYTINTEETRLTLWLYWETVEPPSEGYHRFVHLLNEKGEIVSQADGIPLGGWLPTNRWQPGVQVVETISLRLPAEQPAGSYRLLTGLYTFPEIARLPAVDASGDRWLNDAVLLQEITLP